MNDMSSVIVPKSDQINADDLIGGDMTITINDVKIAGGQEQPVSIYFDGSPKAFRPCKSMSRVLVAAWGPDAKQYIGRSLQLYRDPTVKWGGLEVGGIRIRAMTHIEQPMTMALTATKGSRKPYTVRPLVAAVQSIEQAPSLRAAAQAIGDATTLDELKTAWSQKWMAPFRDKLQADLDKRKADLSFDAPAEHEEGPADTDRGETFNTEDDHPDRIRAAEIIALLNGARNAGLVDAIEKECQADIDAMPEDVRAEVVEALERARERAVA